MEHIKYDQRNKIATIIIDRPNKLNALNLAAMREIAECWRMFQKDDSAWVAVLTSTGDRAFSVGADLKDGSRTGNEDERELFELELRLSPKNFGITKPIICAIKTCNCVGIIIDGKSIGC